MMMLSNKEKLPVGKFSKQHRFKLDNLELNRKSYSPSPNAYTSISFTELNKVKNLGNSFGKSPKDLFKNSITPGPGRYKNEVYNPESNLSYSMRMKPKKDFTHWNVNHKNNIENRSWPILNKKLILAFWAKL